MKKNFCLMVLAAIVLAGCGNNKRNEEGSGASDSALTLEQESPVAGPAEYFLTADSIGAVHVGEAISDLPPAIPNLYDMMVTTETPDALAYTFLLGDVAQFTVYDFLDGRVDVIALEGNARGVETPKGTLRVDDEFAKVLQLPGVEAEWQNLDNTGIWYWKWNGLYFGVNETGNPKEFDEALCEGKRPPRAALFTADIKIGYIATGLPF